jgi:hypothetical protein
MKLLLVFLALSLSALAKDAVTVEVKAAHAVTHEDQSATAMVRKGLEGSHGVTRHLESFNLDTVINGERVLLACDDPKGCEAPAPGNYDGELVRKGKWVKLTFAVPLRDKSVTRWYRVAGSW